MCKSPGCLGRRRSQLVLAVVARAWGKTRTGGSERPCRAVGAACQGTPGATAGHGLDTGSSHGPAAWPAQQHDEMTTPEPIEAARRPAVWTPPLTRSEPLGHCHLLTPVLIFARAARPHEMSSDTMLANSK